jgi:predicted nuclease of restriction endonuclease-like (RecB) superfamily
MIFLQQQKYGWGANITKNLSKDIKNELPKIKGFSERNLKFMVQFYKEYISGNIIGKQVVSQLPWGHNILLMQKIKSKDVRIKYIEQTITEGWSRDILTTMIKK